MGLFSRKKWYDDPRLKEVRHLSSYTAPGGWYAPEWLAKTVLTRLAHLIQKMEVRPCNGWTVSASKWFLQNLDRAPLVPEIMPVVNDLTARLRRAIAAYEAETGEIWDAKWFAQHVAAVYDKPDAILFGPSKIEQISGYGPAHNTPAGKLTDIISAYCWPSSSWGT